ncbi:hypothetical protein Lser_V15G07558 [Lactuca serriola]
MSLTLEFFSILILFMFRLVSAASESGFLNLPSYQHFISDKDRPTKSLRLSNPLIGDDQKIYTCLEKNLMIFHNTGSISRMIPLNYTCNLGITPVLGASRKIVYLVAGNRVLRVDTTNTRISKNATQVFLGPETGVEGMNEIIGLSISITSFCVLVTIKRTGLFAYSYDGKLRWSTGPVITQSKKYRQGCWKNFTDCFFDSAPVIDHCDANIYVWNNQGELYAVSIRSPHFKWIQNLSSFGKNLTVTAGNNGKVYITVADRAIVLGLDAGTGSVVWTQNIGPLSTQDPDPVVDISGWISIGSLDGFLYSISPSGTLKKFPEKTVIWMQRIYVNDTVMVVNPVLDCSGYAVYISQRKFEGKISQIIGEYTYVSAGTPLNADFKLVVPTTGSVYWNASYPGSVSNLFYESDLRHFLLDESVLLAFLSVSDTGNPFPCFGTQEKHALRCSMMETKHVTLYTGNEKAIILFLFFETILMIVLVGLVQFCCIFWMKKKVKNQDLAKFLEKRKSLRIQKKVFDRTITELQKKAASNEEIEQLGDLVREREDIERKLSTTYSLGKDTTTQESKSLIPLSDKKSGSLSFKSGRRKESMATISNSSSEDDSDDDNEVEEGELKGKGSMEIESFSDDEALNIVQTQVKILDEGDNQRDLPTGGGSMRRRPLSLRSTK